MLQQGAASPGSRARPKSNDSKGPLAVRALAGKGPHRLPGARCETIRGWCGLGYQGPLEGRHGARKSFSVDMAGNKGVMPGDGAIRTHPR